MGVYPSLFVSKVISANGLFTGIYLVRRFIFRDYVKGRFIYGKKHFSKNTQYLYDINNICFFDGMFTFLDLKNDGRFLGNDVNKVCQGIVSEKDVSQERKNTLNEQIHSASSRVAEKYSSDVVSRTSEPEKTK